MKDECYRRLGGSLGRGPEELNSHGFLVPLVLLLLSATSCWFPSGERRSSPCCCCGCCCCCCMPGARLLAMRSIRSRANSRTSSSPCAAAVALLPPPSLPVACDWSSAGCETAAAAASARGGRLGWAESATWPASTASSGGRGGSSSTNSSPSPRTSRLLRCSCSASASTAPSCMPALAGVAVAPQTGPRPWSSMVCRRRAWWSKLQAGHRHVVKKPAKMPACARPQHPPNTKN